MIRVQRALLTWSTSFLGSLGRPPISSSRMCTDSRYDCIPSLAALRQPETSLQCIAPKKSASRDHLVSTLEAHGYAHQEFLLTPTQFGIPNQVQLKNAQCGRMQHSE